MDWCAVGFSTPENAAGLHLTSADIVDMAVFVNLIKVLQVRTGMTTMAPSLRSQKELTYALLDSKENGNIWALIR